MTNFEEKDMMEVVSFLKEVPGGKELFSQYYVSSGLASEGTWERFIRKEDESKE